MSHPILRRGGLILSGGLLLYSTISMLLFNFWNAGNFALLLLGAAGLLYLAFYDRMPHRAHIILNLLWAVGLTALAALTAVMLWFAHGNVPDADNPPGTVVILGAKINGDSPSLILQQRLKSAFDYLERHPQAVVVCSGGLGDGETYAESEVMRLYLEARGISSDRIYEENASTNTAENLAYSAGVIRKNGLDPNVALCTDGFHQLRAALQARHAGLTPTAISSRTPPGLIPMYYAREWLGVAKTVLIDRIW